jgi:hypothetical protein
MHDGRHRRRVIRQITLQRGKAEAAEHINRHDKGDPEIE